MYYFIVNPHSRSGRGMQTWKQVEEELEKLSMEYRVFFTSDENHATDLAEEFSQKGSSRTLIAVGGDGTVNEVINGIRDFENTYFGYIPSGSSNDFARSMHLPTDPVEALHNILHPSCNTRIDLGELECGGKKRLFAGSCGIGFDAAVSHAALRSRMKDFFNRMGLGKLTYAGFALRQLLLLRPYPIRMLLDGSEKKSFQKIFFVSFMNDPYEGGGLKMCPQADPCDGKLDLCVVKSLNRLLFAFLLPTAYKGKHTRFSCIHMSRAATIKLRAAVPLPVHVDGESCELHDRLSVRCLPGRLRLITSEDFPFERS